MSNSTPLPQGLIGFLFQGELASPEAAACDSLCGMAEKLRRKIIQALFNMEMCPDRPIVIDGETWAPDRTIKALRELYDWTYQVCQMEEAPAVVFTSSNQACPGDSC